MANKIYTYRGIKFRKSTTATPMYKGFTYEFIKDVYPYEYYDGYQWQLTPAYSVEETKTYINKLIRRALRQR